MKKDKKEKKEKKNKAKKEKAKKPSAQARRAARKAERAARPKRFRFDSRFPFIHRVKLRKAADTHFMKVSGAETDERNRMLVTNISSAVVLGAAMSVVLLLSDVYMLVPFVLPGVILFVLYTILGEKLSKKVKLISTGIILLFLIVLLAVMWKYLQDGAKLILNEIYTIAEEYQAYVYDRFEPGDAGYSYPNVCMYLAVAWASMVIGLIAAVFPYKYRRAVNIALFAGAAAIIAYFGIVPEWISVSVLLAAMLISMCNGRIAPSWPLLLMAVIVFGALILIDPGELMPVSRANENIRDKFAYKTAYMVDYTQYDTGYDEEMTEDTEQDDMSLFDENNLPHLGKKAKIAIVCGIILLALIITFLIIFIRITRRRRSNREGLDSDDPVIAVRAMFPYAMRWLRLYGIRIANVPYSDLLPQIESKTPGGYVTRFKDMNELWERAAFSDHEITEKDLDTMDEFMEDTIDMTKERLRFKDRIMARLKYAL